MNTTTMRGQVESAIQALEEKSIIIFRHNLNSYHVFRASDLDVNRLILDWVDRVKSGVDWTEALPRDKLILANAHYHRTGVMRWGHVSGRSHSRGCNGA